MRRAQPAPILTVEAAVVEQLSGGGATMQQLAKAVRRTIPGVRSALHRLAADGVVRVKWEAIETRGRPADLWSLTARGERLAGQQRQEMRRLLGIAEAS